MTDIQKALFSMSDPGYKEFHARLIPEVDKDTIIGVRTPDLRKYAKMLAKSEECGEFLKALPHSFYEENNLHGALLNLCHKDLDSYLAQLEGFLPYIDNWATCDTICPKIFKKDPAKVLEHVKTWLVSEHIFTVRFGIVTLLGYYLDECFTEEIPKLVLAVRRPEYYIQMAVAWFFSIALIKQYDRIIPYFTEASLDKWTHNKAIQKARESYRISPEIKEYLKSLKV